MWQMEEFLKCVRVWHVIQDRFETLAEGIQSTIVEHKELEKNQAHDR